jgi:hypothetical protein
MFDRTSAFEWSWTIVTTDATTELSPADREALQRAMRLARRDSDVARQLDAKLAQESWENVAAFAAYSLQCDNLRLKPWQHPPVWIDDPADPSVGAHPGQDRTDGRDVAAELLRRLLAHGLIRFEPDPLDALAKADCGS